MTKKQKEHTPDTEKVEEKEVEAEEKEEESSPILGEETSDIQNIGGSLYRVVVDDDGTHYVPL